MKVNKLKGQKLITVTMFLPLLTLAFIIAVLFFKQTPLATAAGTVYQGVTIISPEDGGYYIDTPSIYGTTDPGITSLAVDLDGIADTVTADVYGNWQYSRGDLGEGMHMFSAAAGSNSSSLVFTIDHTSPTVLTNVYPEDNMTQVSVDTVIKAQMYEAYGLNNNFLGQAISLEQSDGSMVPGRVEEMQLTSELTEFTFIPTDALQPNMVYIAKINNSITDWAGNKVWARSWKFTTSGNSGVENPHGNYADNVNICINCHDTHAAKDKKLEDSRYPELLNQQVDNYCNACHDGTAAPIPENWTGTYKHDAQMSMDGSSGTSSCAACHNPHLNWTSDNPNLLQDHYVHQHNDPTNPFLPNDSKEQLCETCHDPGYMDTSDSSNQVNYYTFQSKTWTTTTGVVEDYSLCLRCHDGSKATDISTYYQDFSSEHNIVAEDGSSLQGHLPCAECHSTHGSDNLFFLKTELGQSNLSSQGFTTATSEWDVSTERFFCTRCHNNQTELYGKIVPLSTGRSAHQPGSNRYCHDCHGGSAIAAAHAPQS